MTWTPIAQYYSTGFEIDRGSAKVPQGQKNSDLSHDDTTILTALKEQVREFWDAASCGECLYLDETTADGYRAQLEERYRLEPFIPPFAEFSSWRGKNVLEIGVGLGADHQMFAEGGAVLTGIDLSERAISHVRRRFELFGLGSDLSVSDAENLALPDNSFDLVYSNGVIHHSPDTTAAAREIYRVLKPGGVFKVMIYHKYSAVGFMLWLRYALLRARPLTSFDVIYAKHLESPGTKAYSRRGARELFAGFDDVTLEVELCHGDLLSSQAGQRHEGKALEVARIFWPRWFIRRFCKGLGLFLFVQGRKPVPSINCSRAPDLAVG